MAYLTNTPGQFNHWNYTDENDYYVPFEAQGGNSKPWQERLADEKQWGDLKEKDFIKFARSEGFTGPKDRAFDFLLGKTDKTGTIDVPFGDYNSGGVMGPGINSGAMHPLLGYLKENNPALWQDFQAGKHYSPNNEHVGPMIGAGMLGVGALAAGAAGGGLVGGASGAEVVGATGGGTLAGGVGSASAGAGAAGSAFAGGAAGGEVVGDVLTGTLGGDVTGAVGGALSEGVTITDVLSKIPASVWSSGAQAVLKYIGMNKMGKAYEDAANKFFAMGDPYRKLLLESYQPGFSLWDDPAYRKSFKRAADISTRQWSARGGNPANNPGIAGNIMDDLWNKSYLPALNDYRSGLLGGTSMGTDSATKALLDSIPYSEPAISAGGTFLEGVLNAPKKDDLDLTVGGVRY